MEADLETSVAPHDWRHEQGCHLTSLPVSPPPPLLPQAPARRQGQLPWRLVAEWSLWSSPCLSTSVCPGGKTKQEKGQNRNVDWSFSPMSQNVSLLMLSLPTGIWSVPCNLATRGLMTNWPFWVSPQGFNKLGSYLAFSTNSCPAIRR